MKVAHLIKKLQQCDQNADVLISYNRDEDADEVASVRIETWPLNDEQVVIISDSDCEEHL